MKSALLRLREYRDSISPTERTIADYLLDHPESAMECGVHELAERTFSSASTIIRMCRRIGFDGYKDFRRAVTYEAALRRHNEGRGGRPRRWPSDGGCARSGSGR